MRTRLPLIVFSHLRWDSVYQRPQQLMSRLAAGRRVIFIEEPAYDEAPQPYWELTVPSKNLLAARPCTPNGKPGFHDAHLTYLPTMVQELLSMEGISRYAVWLYTPMALPLARTLSPWVVAFDCMDQLSTFRNAPAELIIQREKLLMQWADVVFTGGPSLYRARAGQHPNIHCLPSSVDASHFQKALTATEPDDQRSLLHPRLGFYGVIDERIDLRLLDALAQARPEWQIVMVGPLAKIKKADLPFQANIHYLGKRDYSELPSYLAGWDVCLLPFALNEATRFISPTKTLEYMAAERPIVSTPITDVVEPYRDIVYLGTTPEEFIAACEQALNPTPVERQRRALRAGEVLASTSWDATAQRIDQLIEEAVEQQARPFRQVQPDPALPQDDKVA